MRIFDTPEPISVTIEVGLGGIEIVASDRRDTTVDVRPSDPSKSSDVTAAEQTHIEYASGNLVVKAPKGWRRWTPRGDHGSIEVRVELPADSQVIGIAGVASLRCTGRIGECRYEVGVGDVRLERAGSLEIRGGVGDVSVDTVDGKADITTAGAVRIDRIDGPAIVKNRNGDTWIGAVTGEARVNAANGAISIGHADAGVVAKTANGDVALGEVLRGSVVAQSALGTVDVGVRDGVSAWLDLGTKFGAVQNDLEAVERPEPGVDAVEVHAHTSMGDITLHRSFAGAPDRQDA
jgi:hypothetical protein